MQVDLPTQWLDGALSSAVIGLVIWLIAKNQKDGARYALIGCILVLNLLDINRLQAWIWMWLLLLLAYKHKWRGLPTGAWVLAGMYVWSGLHKMTTWFTDYNYGFLCDAFAWTQPLKPYTGLGYVVAAIEVLLGVGLLWPRSRRVAAVGVIVMHLYIVAVLSPWGHNWNHVVIPWNLAMMALVVHFFWSLKSDPAPTAPSVASRRMTILLLLLTWVMPLFNSFRWWPESLSWKMYANTQPEATLYVPNGPPCTRHAALWNRYAEDGGYFALNNWAYHELQVPMFCSDSVFHIVARRMTDCPEAPLDSIKLDILHVE
jgi:uncharacterized membrane protein YphA (DoxX/SURF4 family)